MNILEAYAILQYSMKPSRKITESPFQDSSILPLSHMVHCLDRKPTVYSMIVVAFEIKSKVMKL